MIEKRDNSLSKLLEEFKTSKSLIYGIGNIGREDDGLGWELVDFLEEQKRFSKCEFVKNYQLHLEDADLINQKERVLFIDATKKEDIESFKLSIVKPSIDLTFTSHAISVESILATCKLCFNKAPEVYLLEIRGYSWELKVGLTKKAKENLDIIKKVIGR